MGPRQPHSTVLSAEQEATIVAFRRQTLLPLSGKIRRIKIFKGFLDGFVELADSAKFFVFWFGKLNRRVVGKLDFEKLFQLRFRVCRKRNRKAFF